MVQYVPAQREESADQKKNPFKKHIDVDLQSSTQPCLVPFVIWQEGDVSILPSEMSSITEELDRVENAIADTLLDTNSQKDCELDDGIFVEQVCHYYQVLNRLCIKVDEDEDGQVFYDDGCYADGEPGKFKSAQVGSFYDFEETVSLEIRAS